MFTFVKGDKQLFYLSKETGLSIVTGFIHIESRWIFTYKKMDQSLEEKSYKTQAITWIDLK